MITAHHLRRDGTFTMKFIPDNLLATASNWQQNLLSQPTHVKQQKNKRRLKSEEKKPYGMLKSCIWTDVGCEKKAAHFQCDRVQMINHENVLKLLIVWCAVKNCTWIIQCRCCPYRYAVCILSMDQTECYIARAVRWHPHAAINAKLTRKIRHTEFKRRSPSIKHL